MDGIGTGGATGGVSLLIVDTGNSAEITVSTTGGLADAEIGGPVINVVPRTGGNALSGQFFFAGAGPAMQSDNFTQELKDAGLRSPSELKKVWDVNLAVGGPIKRDKLWFFATTRNQGSYVTISDTYFNKNAGDPNAWTYVPDLTISRRPTGGGRARRCGRRGRCRRATRSRCSGTSSTSAAPARAAAARRSRRRQSGPTDVPWMRAYQAVWTAPCRTVPAGGGLLGHGLQLRPGKRGEQSRPDPGDGPGRPDYLSFDELAARRCP